MTSVFITLIQISAIYDTQFGNGLFSGGIIASYFLKSGCRNPFEWAGMKELQHQKSLEYIYKCKTIKDSIFGGIYKCKRFQDSIFGGNYKCKTLQDLIFGGNYKCKRF